MGYIQIQTTATTLRPWELQHDSLHHPHHLDPYKTVPPAHLLKEEHLLGIQPKPGVRLEEGPGLHIRGGAGHYVPGYAWSRRAFLPLGQLLQPQQALSVQPKQGLAGRQADVIAALGRGATQAGALAAGEEEASDPAAGDGCQTQRPPLPTLLLGSVLR